MDLYLFDDGETGLELDMIRLSIVFLASISRAILFVFVLFCFFCFPAWFCGFCGCVAFVALPCFAYLSMYLIYPNLTYIYIYQSIYLI